MTEIRPFRVEISDAVIDDLRERLARTRWLEKEPVEDWSMGIPLAYVQELAAYWAEAYNMQRVADQLNRYEQFTTAIDGLDIHVLRVRSPVEGATPCIMTHGWPGSVMEFIKVIDPLVDPVNNGAAQGGDWGALVSSAIGRLADPATLIGIHVNWALAHPAKLIELGGPSEEEQSYLARLHHSSEAEGGYAIEQGTKPQTLGYGLTDSPVGQLAWIVEKFKTWSDCGNDLESSFTKDELLDNVMVYWTCAAASSSARLYWYSLASSVGSFDEVPAPAAYSRFPADNVALSEGWARTRFTDLRYYGIPAWGGHFAAYEAPAEFVAEVRAGLRALLTSPIPA
jgi:epoxide hydrolase